MTNETPGDTEFTAEDVAAARDYLTGNEVDIEGMDDAKIIAAAIDALDADPVSPGGSGDKTVTTPDPEKAVADLKAKMKEGDTDAVLEAFEKLSADRAQDQQVIQAIGGAVSNLVTKSVLSGLKDQYPTVTHKKSVAAIQEKAATLLKTGEYEMEDALVEAAHLVMRPKGSKTQTEPGQKIGLDKLRALKSGGSPSTKTERSAPEAQTYDQWADSIGKLVVAGRFDEAKALRERGFTQAK
jgi:hypothetical protein